MWENFQQRHSQSQSPSSKLSPLTSVGTSEQNGGVRRTSSTSGNQATPILPPGQCRCCLHLHETHRMIVSWAQGGSCTVRCVRFRHTTKHSLQDTRVEVE